MVSSPSASQRTPTPITTWVGMRFSTSQMMRMISSVRATSTLISMMALITFSLRISVRMSPVLTSVIRVVMGLFFSNETPALARARDISWKSRKRAPMPGRPSSMVKPTWPMPTRSVTSLVFTSSVPRPETPVDSWGTRGSEKARRTTRGHSSWSGSKAVVGQTSGSGSKRTRKLARVRRTKRTVAGGSTSLLRPL